MAESLSILASSARLVDSASSSMLRILVTVNVGRGTGIVECVDMFTVIAISVPKRRASSR